MNNVDDGMVCAGVDQGGESQHLMLMAIEEVERLMVAMMKLERMALERMVELKRVPPTAGGKARQLQTLSGAP